MGSHKAQKGGLQRPIGGIGGGIGGASRPLSLHYQWLQARIRRTPSPPLMFARVSRLDTMAMPSGYFLTY